MSSTAPTTAPERQRQPGALVGALALIVGGLWLAGAAAAAFVLLGLERIQALLPVEIGALAAAVVLPGLMAWFSGIAAGDSARARAEAARLADATDRLLNPERSAENSTRKLAASVRHEIGTLDRALEQTLSRLHEVELQIARHAQSVDSITDQARVGAGQMISGLERERQELLSISQDLTSRAQAIGDSISKHTQSISQAARLAEVEVRAADEALDNRLTSFGAAAALITDRTQGLTSAAQTSANSALRLEKALSNALVVLAKATNLTDAARQSAEAASLAANSTAGAIRDTTTRAVEDAKRAAEAIRGEAVNVEAEALAAMERLREAAEGARAAAISARAAVEETARAETVRARARTAPEPQYAPREPSWRDETDPLESAPPPRARRAEAERPRRTERPQRGDELFGDRDDEQQPAPSNWTWRELLSSNEKGAPPPPRPAAPRSQGGEDPVAHLRRQISQPRSPIPPAPIIDVIERAEIWLGKVFSPSALERIAQRARSGAQARRRAVHDAAPDAARRLAEHLARDAKALQEANQFLHGDGAQIAELLAAGRAPMSAEATQAFLLLDAVNS